MENKKIEIVIGKDFINDKINLKILDIKEEIRGKTKKKHIFYKYRCNKCGNVDWINRISLVYKNCGCNACCNPPKKTTLGINTIWDKAKWMCDLGVSEEDAKKYTPQSNQRINVKCPLCGNIKNIKVNNIYNSKSINCICSDNYSYPEKFMYSFLKQLKINFITQYSPNYLVLNGSRKYSDFYIEDKKIIIETDGRLGHLGGVIRSDDNETLEEHIEIDNWKDEQHGFNGIKTIRINCFQSNKDYIKNNIVNSDLNKEFDLSNIDWDECDKYAIASNRIKDVCDYYNSVKDTELDSSFNIGLYFSISSNTVVKYLKQGNKLGWCVYSTNNVLRERSRKNGLNNSKRVNIYKNGELIGSEYSSCELERISLEKYGVHLSQAKISLVCLGKKKQYKGFTFKYQI